MSMNPTNLKSLLSTFGELMEDLRSGAAHPAELDGVIEAIYALNVSEADISSAAAKLGIAW